MSKHIRDPLYGYIEVSEAERRIIDSPKVQRLRELQQLGLSSLVYPSATHTRFSHSIGVMHIAGRLAESIGLDETSVTEARMAGLLHDTGHGPYSHASEEVMERHGVEHEEVSCDIVDDMASSIPADAERVKEYIRGEADIGIIAGAVDADRLDYLRRDSLFTGLEHGRIDTETIVKFGSVENGKLVFDWKAMQALEGFLTARSHMIKSVYSHHTSRISETMLQRALDQYVRENSVDSLLSMTDHDIHSVLKNMDGDARFYYDKIQSRDLYKRCLILGETELARSDLITLSEEIENPKHIESRIAEKSDIDSKYVLIDEPSIPKDKPFDINIQTDSGIKQFGEVSPVADMMKEDEWRVTNLSVFTPEKYKSEVREDAREIVDEIIGRN